MHTYLRGRPFINQDNRIIWSHSYDFRVCVVVVMMCLDALHTVYTLELKISLL